MINKEIILGNGNIVKDFSDRNIPQNSHNQVCVSFLIPSNQFNDYDDYSVLTAVSRKVGNTTTPLNALVLTASKSITIEGINYIKFSCVLSIDYTNVLGELYFSPYIQATKHTDLIEDADEETEDIEVEVKQLLNQSGFTNCRLNIIRAVAIQEDASVEDLTIASTLASQINSKKIYYNAEWNALTDASENMLYYNIATSYNPSVALYNGSIVAIKNQNVVSFYFPYLNSTNVELFKMTNEGVFYKISGISRTGEGTEQSPYIYNATKQKLTYAKAEIDSELDLKVDKTTTINDKPLSSDIEITKVDVGLGNVANYGVETTPTAVGNDLYITSKGVYDALQLVYTAISGCATDEDLTTINNRLDSIEAIIGSDDGDADSVINTLKEVIVVLNGLGEGASLLNLINAKANQTDLTALDNEINATGGIKDKVDLLVARNNAYMEIKNSLGTIDILTTDWVENTGDTDFPYKWELTNGYLEGAVNCIVVYSKDSDTSMLSATTGIDEENGKIIIYASELPAETISIEKIAVFNDLNAYINYSNEIVQQVNSNTSAISDINNTKLPQYVKKTESYTDGSNNTYTTQFYRSNKYLNIYVSKNNAKRCYLQADGDNGIEIAYQEKTGISWQDNPFTKKITLDADGVKIDGNAIGGGGIPVITLQASQMVDSTHIQFTEEQYNTIANNGAFYLDILGSQQVLMTCVNESILSDIQCYNISQTGSGLQLATIDLNKSTYIGVLGISPYPQAKQLYQHYVRVLFDSQPYLVLFDIINDNPNQMFTTKNDISAYLSNNNFSGSSWNLSTKVLRASGTARNTITSQEIREVRGLYTRPNLSNSIYAIGLNASGSFLDMQVVATDVYIEENVEAL